MASNHLLTDTKRDVPGYVNLDYVVKSVCNSLKEYSTHNWKHYLQLAAEGFSEINLFAVNNVKVVYLTVNSNGTVDLPDDFVTMSKIGVLINGKVWTLTYNREIALPRRVDECGRTVAEVVNCSTAPDRDFFPTWGFYFANHFRNGQYVGEMFGLGGGFNEAYYRFDMERRQISLSSEIPQGEVILEYQSSGIRADGCTVIRREVVPALREYVLWKRIEYRDDVPMNTKMRREEQYYIQYDLVKFLSDSFTMEEYLDNCYMSYKSGPKR